MEKVREMIFIRKKKKAEQSSGEKRDLSDKRDCEDIFSKTTLRQVLLVTLRNIP